MPGATRGTATIADLMRIKDKAELINGHVVTQPPNGYWQARLAMHIMMSLDRHVEILGVGETFLGLLAYALLLAPFVLPFVAWLWRKVDPPPPRYDVGRA